MRGSRRPALLLPLLLLLLLTTSGEGADATCGGDGGDGDGEGSCSSGFEETAAAAAVGSTATATGGDSHGWLRYSSPLDGPCTIDRVAASSITFRTFTKTFKNKKPVVLTGLHERNSKFRQGLADITRHVIDYLLDSSKEGPKRFK